MNGNYDIMLLYEKPYLIKKLHDNLFSNETLFLECKLSLSEAWGGEYITFSYRNLKIIVMFATGSVIAACAVERAKAMGVKQIVQIGTAGLIDASKSLLVPILIDGAIKDEGTSRFYLDESVPAIADTDLTNLFANYYTNEGIVYYRGLGITTDGRYKEDLDKYKFLSCHSTLLCADLEASTLYTVSMFYKIKCLSIKLGVDQILGSGYNGTKLEYSNIYQKIVEHTKQTLEILCDR